jgi:hypothetical protein
VVSYVQEERLNMLTNNTTCSNLTSYENTRPTTFNQWVAGSNPARLTTFSNYINTLGGVTLRGSTCADVCGSNTEASWRSFASDSAWLCGNTKKPRLTKPTSNICFQRAERPEPAQKQDIANDRFRRLLIIRFKKSGNFALQRSSIVENHVHNKRRIEARPC